MFNKYHLLHLKSARKKKIKKKQQLENNASDNQKILIIHNLANPFVNPLRLNLQKKPESERTQQGASYYKSAQKTEFNITTRRTLHNHSFSRHRQKNKTISSSEHKIGYKTISEKQLSKLRQLITKMKKNEANSSSLLNFYSPKMQRSELSLKTLSHDNRESSPTAKYAKAVQEQANGLQSILANKKRYFKTSAQSKSIFRNKILEKLKPKDEESKNIRLTLNGWATKQEYQI